MPGVLLNFDWLTEVSKKIYDGNNVTTACVFATLTLHVFFQNYTLAQVNTLQNDH